MSTSSARVCAKVLLAVAAFIPAAARAQADASSISIHGYLTQAYGASGNGLVMGLSSDGTTDYRRAAVVARYQATPKDHFVVQVGHRRLGDSPTMAFEDNLKLDMAFYERRFDMGTRLRVGKSLLPFGILNEVRYAGTVLPLYRAPFTVYGEGMYTSETIDGVVLSHRFRSGEPWGISIDAFGGSFGLLESGVEFAPPPAPPRYTSGEMQAKNVVGGQVWMTTPVDGLRFGAGGRSERDFGGIYPRPGGAAMSQWSASMDGTFERWQLRVEAVRINTSGILYDAAYAQIGVRPLPWLSLNVQSELADLTFDFAPADPMKLARDNAASINLHLGPTMVLKLEAHRTRGFAYEELVDVSGGPLRGSYFISSFSVGF